MIYDVVLLLAIMVTILCQEMLWLCVQVCVCRVEDRPNVLTCVAYVVLMVELGVTCYCYDCVGHGEIYGGLG